MRHAWPPNWKRPAAGKLAVIQPWEFGSLPEEWVQPRRVTWTNSGCRPITSAHVYVESGVPAEKVVVVPNGVDAEKFHPQAAPMKLATQKKFKFLFVGGTIGRKGPDLLLQAYLKNFTAADDVCLVIKDFGGKSVYAGQTFEAANPRRAGAAESRRKFCISTKNCRRNHCPDFTRPAIVSCCRIAAKASACRCWRRWRAVCRSSSPPAARRMILSAMNLPIAFRRSNKIFGREVSGMKLAGDGWLLEPRSRRAGRKNAARFQPSRRSPRTRTTCQPPCAPELFVEKCRRHCRATHSRTRDGCQRAGENRRSNLRPSNCQPSRMLAALDEARELFAQKKFRGRVGSGRDGHCANVRFIPKRFCCSRKSRWRPATRTARDNVRAARPRSRARLERAETIFEQAAQGQCQTGLARILPPQSQSAIRLSVCLIVEERGEISRAMLEIRSRSGAANHRGGHRFDRSHGGNRPGIRRGDLFASRGAMILPPRATPRWNTPPATGF